MGWLELIKLSLMSFLEISKDIKAIREFFHSQEVQDWFQASSDLRNQLSKPTTSQEKMDAAEKTQELIKNS